MTIFMVFEATTEVYDCPALFSSLENARKHVEKRIKALGLTGIVQKGTTYVNEFGQLEFLISSGELD